MSRRIFAIAIFLISLSATAQRPSFTTGVDTNALLIGEQVVLQMKAQLQQGTEFQWPLLPDTVPGLEIVEEGSVDTAAENGFWTITQNIRLTSFDSGTTSIPPLNLQVGTKTYQSAAIPLQVQLPELSEDQDYYDIKSPREAPFNWQQALMIAGLIILVAAAVWATIYFIRKRKKPQAEEPAYHLSPYEHAREQLRELEQEQLWQAGRIKEYYSHLTDILRLYLERQMLIPAMESTADEVSEQVGQMNISGQLKQQVRELMSLSAMVKYAKEQPGQAAHERSLQTVKTFIEETKPVENENA